MLLLASVVWTRIPDIVVAAIGRYATMSHGIFEAERQFGHSIVHSVGRGNIRHAAV